MNILTRYTFISSYNAEKLNKQDAAKEGIGSVDFLKCDTDGDGNITIDEILANQEVCDKLLKAIQSKIDKVTAEEASVKAEQAKSDKESGQQLKLAA